MDLSVLGKIPMSSSTIGGETYEHRHRHRRPHSDHHPGHPAHLDSLARSAEQERSTAAFVYVLRCADDSLYCGWTYDLERRIAQHGAGRASRYTRSRRPVALAWSRAMRSRSEAMREEARIKKLSRAHKLRLIGRSA